MYAATARDEDKPSVDARPGRTGAQELLEETLGTFHHPGADRASSCPAIRHLWGAVVYLVAGVVYLPLYLFGTFGIRSLRVEHRRWGLD